MTIYYTVAEHAGECCLSCEQDEFDGYPIGDGCCCRSEVDRDS